MPEVKQLFLPLTQRRLAKGHDLFSRQHYKSSLMYRAMRGKKRAVSECCGASFGLVKNISSSSFCNTCPDCGELLDALRNTGDSNQLRLFSLPLRARSEAAKSILSCSRSHDAINVVEIKDRCFISTWNELRRACLKSGHISFRESPYLRFVSFPVESPDFWKW